MSIICTICARGGSKGLTDKALRKVNRKPLISYTIRQAIKSKIFDEVVVSTDSKKIQKIAKQYGAKSWFLRPKDFSNDKSSKLLAIRHALIESENYFNKKIKICVDLDITAPLRKIADIKNALKKFKKKKYNNLFSVCSAKKNPYFNMVEFDRNKNVKLVKNKDNSNKFSRSFSSDYSIVRRQDAPLVYEMNASIYIFTRDTLINRKKLINKKTTIFEMPRERSIDIDDIYDLNLVRLLIKDDKKLFR
tara:strand:- start:434 stop:1177 length:744 start_codon:yes stop_codon:yes gene_type:complete